MDLPEFAHALALDFEYEGRELTLYPVAIETDRGLLLLDVGPPASIDQLVEEIETVGFGVEDVALILLTHQDADHVGGLSSVVEESDATVVAHQRAAPVVDGRKPPRGSNDEERYPPQRVDVEFANEATLDTRAGPAMVIPTPGHTPGHVSVYLPEEQFLIAADALTVDDDGLAGPRPDMSEDVERARSSLERLADLDVERTFCYHGGLVAEGSERIGEISGE